MLEGKAFISVDHPMNNNDDKEKEEMRGSFIKNVRTNRRGR
jgi:hypothetical protein